MSFPGITRTRARVLRNLARTIAPIDDWELAVDGVERLQPLLPNKSLGVPWVDDRRVISGIVHVLQSGYGGRMRFDHATNG